MKLTEEGRGGQVVPVELLERLRDIAGQSWPAMLRLGPEDCRILLAAVGEPGVTPGEQLRWRRADPPGGVS